MKIIFLDFDGVVNTLQYNFSRGEVLGVDKFDPSCVGYVSRLVAIDPEIRVVVTASARMAFSYEDMKKLFHKNGLNVKLHDDYVTFYEDGDRPNQIKAWLVRHPEVTNYLILDDDPFAFSDDQKKHWVQTDVIAGLTPDGFEKSCEILFGSKTAWVGKDYKPDGEWVYLRKRSGLGRLSAKRKPNTIQPG